MYIIHVHQGESLDPIIISSIFPAHQPQVLLREALLVLVGDVVRLERHLADLDVPVVPPKLWRLT